MSVDDDLSRSPARSSARPPAGWPDEARALVERAAVRHGGWERYRTLRRVSFSLGDMGGPLPLAKGLHRTHSMPPRIEVSPHEWRTVFLDYPGPGPGRKGVFVRGEVSITTTGPNAQVVQQGKDYRKTFAGLRKYRRWDPLDALYFFGCALCTYQSLPFVLVRTSFVSLHRVRDRHVPGEELSGIVVDFPPELPSHCRRQAFYFDGTGLLRRHDYNAEIVGWWAHGAHYSSEYVDANGLMVATGRRVWATLLGRPTPIPVLHARFLEVTVE